MIQTEYATLCLTTAYGVSNALNTSCSWPNINIRTLLGTMYDKYDTFNLSLESILQSGTIGPQVGPPAVAAPQLGVTSDDSLILIQMAGLPFLNSTYNIRTRFNNYSTILTPQLITTGQNNFIDYSNVIRTFGKAADIVNITIGFLRYDFNIPNTANAFPNMTYIFNIRGIPKDEDNLNNTRMIR
jgi:hypothetical protein